MKNPSQVGEDARVSLIQKLRQIESAKLGEPMPECLRQPGAATGYELSDWAEPLSKLAGEAADALERADRLQSLYDDLMAGYDRLRADTDAAIEARCGENWEAIRPLLKFYSEHARSKP
jgi:hypothetical protein